MADIEKILQNVYSENQVFIGVKEVELFTSKLSHTKWIPVISEMRSLGTRLDPPHVRLFDFRQILLVARKHKCARVYDACYASQQGGWDVSWQKTWPAFASGVQKTSL